MNVSAPRMIKIFVAQTDLHISQCLNSQSVDEVDTTIVHYALCIVH